MTSFHIVASVLIVMAVVALKYIIMLSTRCEFCRNWNTEVIRRPVFGGGSATKITCPVCMHSKETLYDVSGRVIEIIRKDERLAKALGRKAVRAGR